MGSWVVGAIGADKGVDLAARIFSVASAFLSRVRVSEFGTSRASREPDLYCLRRSTV
jgi:hypothetical protein